MLPIGNLLRYIVLEAYQHYENYFDTIAVSKC